jgi:hypothetical protein
MYTAHWRLVVRHGLLISSVHRESVLSIDHPTNVYVRRVVLCVENVRLLFYVLPENGLMLSSIHGNSL